MKNATPAQMRMGLRIHAIAVVSSLVLLLVVNLAIGKPFWIAWVVLGSGVGLLSHWLALRSHLARSLGPESSERITP